MVRVILLVGFAIPGIIAAAFAASLLLQQDIPVSAATPADSIDIEYTKHQLITVSHGVTERTGAQQTEILEISNGGNVRYHLVKDGVPQPVVGGTLEESQMLRLKAIIKETGFMAVPTEPFPVADGVDSYQKSSVRITLNGEVTEVRWPEQNATTGFIPPIITLIGSELDSIIARIRG